MASSKQGTGVIYGRNDEIEFLQGCLGKAISGFGSTVFIIGEAGIGKSRLIEEIDQISIKIGFECYHGKTDQSCTVPYYPFRKMMEEIALDTVMEEGREDLELIHIFDRTICLESSNDVTNVHFRFLKSLSKRSENRPLLIVLEDLQWADSSSLNLLFFLARNVKRKRIVILGSYRPLEKNDSRDGSILEVTEALLKTDSVKILPLAQLEKDNIVSLIHSLLHGPPDIDVVERVSEQSAGNPLFIIELVRLLISNNSLVEKKGVWRWMGKHPVDIPPTINQIIQDRLKNLSPKEFFLLGCASVMGVSFDKRVVEKITAGNDAIDFFQWNKIENEYNIIWNKNGLGVFKHALIHQVIYNAMKTEQRRYLHFSYAEYLEQNGDIFQNLELITTHYHRAGYLEKSVPYSIKAAEKCTAICAYSEAASFYQMAITNLNLLGAEDTTLVYEGLGDCYRELVDLNQARKCYERLLKLNVDPGTRARLLRKMVESTLGDDPDIWNNKMSILLEAESCVGESELERAEIITCLAQTFQENGELEKARSLYEKAIDIFSEKGPPNRFALTLHCLASLEILLGNVDGARYSISKAFDVVKDCISPFVELELTMTSGEIEMISGNYDIALNHFNRGEELAYQMGHNSEVGWAHAYKALINFDMGNLETSYEEASQSLDHMLLLDIAQATVGPKCLLALIQVELGNSDEAERLLLDVEPLVYLMPSNLDSPNMALFHFVKGKYFSLIGEVDNCSFYFSKGFKLSRSKRMGAYYEGLGREWYAECLNHCGDLEASRYEKNMANGIFLKLGNRRYSEYRTSGKS